MYTPNEKMINIELNTYLAVQAKLHSSIYSIRRIHLSYDVMIFFLISGFRQKKDVLYFLYVKNFSNSPICLSTIKAISILVGGNACDVIA